MISGRSGQVEADSTAQRGITALFKQVAQMIAGVLLPLMDESGKVPLAQSAAARQAVRAAVEPLFIRRVMVTGPTREFEQAHLDILITQARVDLRGATAAQRTRLQGRLGMLGQRSALLASASVALRAFDDTGAPLTPYATIVKAGIETATRGVVLRHAAQMEAALADDPAVLAWLKTGRADGFRAMLRGQPAMTWLDTRGYALSDRIWQVSESTLGRIDALLDEGIRTGRSAVNIAKDLERFLRPERRGVRTRTPYGTIGSFDARRLARSEITRAASMASSVSGAANPFVTRARYHMSAMHRVDNCDGTCDAHYATDQAQGGFEPGSEPLPMIDTHPQCKCYITHEVMSREQATAQIRAEFHDSLRGDTVRRPAPSTPVLVDALSNILLWGALADVA